MDDCGEGEDGVARRRARKSGSLRRQAVVERLLHRPAGSVCCGGGIPGRSAGENRVVRRLSSSLHSIKRQTIV